MLSQLALDMPFRSLRPDTFSEDITFGKRTIIYGHNGSGKSSLAELLYQIGNAQYEESLSWTDGSGNRTKLKPGQEAPATTLSVFTKSWVEKNLSEFLDGNSAASIVTFGAEAIGAKEEQEKIEQELKKLHEAKPQIERDFHEAEKATSALVRSVQDAIEGTLRDVDNRKFTKNRYTAPKVGKLLADTPPNQIDPEQHQKNLDDLAHGPRKVIHLAAPPKTDWTKLRHEVRGLLVQNVESELIAELLGNISLQNWLEVGLGLHSEEGACLFCEGEVSNDRLQQLRNHFDDSRRKLQERVNTLIGEIERIRHSYQQWEKSFPNREDFYPEVQTLFERATARERDLLSHIKDFLDCLEENLLAKRGAPEKTGFDALPEPPIPVGEAMKEVCDHHNESANAAEKRQSETATAVLNYLLGAHSDNYQKILSAEKEKRAAFESVAREILEKTAFLQKIRAKQFSSQKMAACLTRDLSSVYGKHHLAIEVSDDGKSYLCRRDGMPAKHLSDGEKNTLALIYFLRQLEDESVQVLSSSRLVVIDDPSSSLDREAIFATHAWLLEALARYGQSIILTHDFEMMRLFLNSQERKVSEHQRLISHGQGKHASPLEKEKADKELIYPKISFLEMRASRDSSDDRSSKLTRISPALLKHPSEYHFLFDRVLAGIEDSNDHELLFLLPNAARRILETFTNFHVPNRPSFEQKLRKIALEDCNESYRDVYDFCNRFSHGEGRETQLVLDAHTVHHQVKRCMELLQKVAPDHYRHMCEATGRKDRDPLSESVLGRP